jgi:DNA-binding transcriptional regulator GbsR (MarR family)
MFSCPTLWPEGKSGACRKSVTIVQYRLNGIASANAATMPDPSAPPPRPADPTERAPRPAPPADPAADRFIEEMGLITQSDRLPRIAGRIWGLLIYEGRVFGLQEMAGRLRVSRASISTNARLLAEMGLIRRVGRPGDRQDYYELGPDPYGRMLAIVGEKMQRTARAIEDAARQIPAGNPGARERAAALSRFYARSHELLRNWIAGGAGTP